MCIVTKLTARVDIFFHRIKEPNREAEAQKEVFPSQLGGEQRRNHGQSQDSPKGVILGQLKWIIKVTWEVTQGIFA